MKPTVCLKITLTAWLINHITCIRVLNVIFEGVTIAIPRQLIV